MSEVAKGGSWNHILREVGDGHQSQVHPYRWQVVLKIKTRNFLLNLLRQVSLHGLRNLVSQ